MARAHDPFDRTSLWRSLGVHGAALVVAVFSTMAEKEPLEFVTYEIEIVSPPSAVQAPESAPATEELVVERPDPTPPEPEPVEETPAEVVPEDPEPEPDPPEREEADPPEPEPDEERTPAATEDEVPEETPDESGEGINVRLEGVRRDYPVYYENIIRQIGRCLRWTAGGNWETTVSFVINRDGSVSDLEFVKQSGNAAFDFEAMGAVDCAGKGRFGELPEDLPFDALPIQFSFRPQGGIRGVVPDPTTTSIQVASQR